jgi:FkbM family methyltransferase
MADVRSMLCSLGSRVVPELAISGRRAAVARRLLPPARGQVVTRTMAGVEVQVGDASEAERFLAHWHRPLVRGYERSPLGRVLAGAASPGAFVDVGANLGMYALLAVAAGWETVRVEPDDRLRAHHERNPALGPFLPVALAAGTGTAAFFADAENLGAASLVSASGAPGAVGQQVQLGTADEALRPLLGSDGAVLLKVDVEGAEVDTIEGARSLLAEVAPVVWCEVRGTESTRAPSTDVGVIERLAAAGYDVARVDDGTLVPVTAGRVAGVYDLVGLPAAGASAALGQWIRTTRLL